MVLHTGGVGILLYIIRTDSWTDESMTEMRKSHFCHKISYETNLHSNEGVGVEVVGQPVSLHPGLSRHLQSQDQFILLSIRVCICLILYPSVTTSTAPIYFTTGNNAGFFPVIAGSQLEAAHTACP